MIISFACDILELTEAPPPVAALVESCYLLAPAVSELSFIPGALDPQNQTGSSFQPDFVWTHPLGEGITDPSRSRSPNLGIRIGWEM